MDFLIQKITMKVRDKVIFAFITYMCCTSLTSAQSISVSGKITSSRFPVSNAMVTIIDEGDTTKQFTALTDSRGSYEIGTITSVKSGESAAPTRFNLGQSYPNPFSSSTAIPYGLKEESKVQITIYDILGRVVRKFNSGYQPTGSYNILWDGRNGLGQLVANGVYFYRLEVNGLSQVKKMVYNQNSNSSFTLPGTFSLADNNSLGKAAVGDEIHATSYTIRVRNTEDTDPYIVDYNLNNVIISNDTTISLDIQSLAIAVVDSDSLRQIIRGFGGSNIVLWRPDMTEDEIETACGTGDGKLGFSIFRIMVEPDSNRWSLSLPSAKKAYEMGATIIAAPWHAPNELSENVTNENDENINRVRYDKYAEYAEHLNDFVDYMNENGVPIYGISIQNEPDIEENWTSWTSDEMFTFMKDYAHAIEGTKVMAPESFHFDRSYSDPILNDPVAAENTDIVCGHIYGSGLSKYPLAEEKGKEIWMTEHLSGEEDYNNSWSWSLSAAEEMNDVMASGMSAYVWWYIVRFYGPISDGGIDRLQKGKVTKKGYTMSQYSRFIRPGYYRIECSTPYTIRNVKVTAYKDPATSRIVIVAVNKLSAEKEYSFKIKNNQLLSSFTTYITSESKSCEQDDDVNVKDGIMKVILEPSSVTTFISN